MLSFIVAKIHVGDLSYAYFSISLIPDCMISLNAKIASKLVSHVYIFWSTEKKS